MDLGEDTIATGRDEPVLPAEDISNFGAMIGNFHKGANLLTISDFQHYKGLGRAWIQVLEGFSAILYVSVRFGI
jgi:hypothetical protein